MRAPLHTDAGPRSPASTEALRTRRIAAALLLVCSAVLAGAVALAPHAPQSAARDVVLAVLAMTTGGLGGLLIIGAPQDKGLGFGGFRLGPWWIGYFVASFGLNSLAWIHVQKGPASLVHQDAVPLAIVLATVALGSWLAGYAVGPPPLLRQATAGAIRWAAPPGAWRLRSRNFAVVLYSIGFLARMAQILVGRYAYLADPTVAISAPSSSTQLLTVLEGFTLFGLILATIDAVVLHPSIRSRVTVGFLFLCELVFGLFSGMKAEFLFTMLALAVVPAVVRARVPRKLVTGAIVGLLLLIPLNTAYRQSVRRHSAVISPGDAANVLPGLIAKTWAPSNLPDALASAPAQLLGRTRQIDSVTIIMQKTPNPIPYKGVSELLTAPIYGVVPRAIWQSKPVLLSGYQFAQDYYKAPSTIYSSDAITFPGDLYRHGSWPTLVAGMLLLGVACRLVQSTLYPGRDLRLVFMYVPLFVLFINMETDAVSILATVFQSFLVALVVTRVSFVSAD